MKKQAWLPVLTLTTSLAPLLASLPALASSPDVTIKCSSKDPVVNLSFLKPYRNEFRSGYSIMTVANDDDKSNSPVFDNLGASDYGDGLFVSPKAFKVNLFYHYTPYKDPIISETIGVLEGQVGADGKWEVTFTQTNRQEQYTKAPLGQEVKLDCEAQK